MPNKNNKKKNKNSLGRALVKSRFTSGQQMNPDGSIRHTTTLNDTHATWANYNSITQETDLQEFLSNAMLSDREFTAERLNMKLISKENLENEFILDENTLEKVESAQTMHKDKLKVPRRPFWDSDTTKEQLEKNEQEEFLSWRRGLVELEEEKEMLMTPYERNLNVWRQLWRVVERSDMIVQIVDARNPLMFRCADVEKYVKEVDSRKQNLLLINKADMLSDTQRLKWANHFEQEGVLFKFFSAAMARKMQEEEKVHAEENDSEERTVAQRVADHLAKVDIAGEPLSEDEHDNDGVDHSLGEADKAKIRILDVEELLELFMTSCPSPLRENDTKSTIGFIGYPNVGKSSTLNALVGSKKVTVSSTPGKTKHFQTIHLPPLPLILCDCPGLVFPSFATTKADMVTNGILPIDNLREPNGPSALLTQRIPKAVFEKVYGFYIRAKDSEGNLVEDKVPTAEELLTSFAAARGYTKSSQGNPDTHRASRTLLKDYVIGKLLYSTPPPGYDSVEFNTKTYETFLKCKGRVSMISKSILGLDGLRAEYDLVNQRLTSSDHLQLEETPSESKQAQRATTDAILNAKEEVTVKLTGKAIGDSYTRTKLYPHQNSVNSTGLSIRPPSNVAVNSNTLGDKKHKKGKKSVKVRTQWTKLD